MDRRLLGSIGEAKAKLHFIEQGYDVFSPETVNPEVDFIIMKDGVIQTVQVKSTSRDTIKLETCYTTVNENRSKKFDATNIDILFAYHEPSGMTKVANAKAYDGRTGVKFDLI